jgi:uncharacterized repeat protein (TIGR03806 family)
MHLRSTALIPSLLALAFACDSAAPANDPCPGTCLEVGPATGDAGAPGPYPAPDAAPRDALPPPAPAVWPPPRPERATCKLPEVPPLATMDTAAAFPALHFDKPLWFGFAPGDGARRYVVEQGGVIWVFEGRQDVAGAAEFLRLPVSRENAEEGLLGLAFHPDYATNGRFFVYYSAPVDDAADRHTVVSAFVRDPGGDAARTAATEQVLLSIPQPYGNHKGGSLLFGPDGYLYLGTGDGGSGGDPQDNGQNPDTLLGKVLRLDVDTADDTCLTPYGIPADNPFAEGRCGPDAAARPEIFALGMRNPWRMSFDRDTGQLWAGEVGQDDWEEVSVIRRGGNFGWRRVEGEVCFRPADCDPTDFDPPVYVYPHTEGKSITGGYVYRGRAFPELYGAYVYGDYANGRVYALRVDERGRTTNTVLAETRRKITSFGEDPEGELYIVTFGAERSLSTLVRAAAVPAPPPLPATLSQTGCFADTAGYVLAAGVVPYDLNSPLWSDGSAKARAFALPDAGRASFDANGHVSFPVGTVLVKTFSLGAPAKRVETRLLVRQASGWQGFSYRWRADQSDADLLVGAETGEYPTPEGALTWSFPSRAQCNDCHTIAGGGSLGPSHAQWQRTVRFDDTDRPQIEALVSAGYVDAPSAEVAARPAFPRPDDEAAPVEARARAMLDANCAFCHQPEGPAVARIDLRAQTPFADTGLCDALPGQGDLEIAEARIVAPGAPERSILHARMSRRGEGQMPTFATMRVDELGVELVRRWIAEMTGCP